MSICPKCGVNPRRKKGQPCAPCENRQSRERRAARRQDARGTFSPAPQVDHEFEITVDVEEVSNPDPERNRPVDTRRILFVPDTHVPYHDPQAWALMLRAARVFRPDTVCLLGDFADFYAVSSHSKNPERAADLKYEVDIVKEKLAELIALGASRNIYVCGNHEDRLERYLMDRAPALFGSVKIPEVLGLDRWEFIPYRSHVSIGKLRVTHDTGKAGQNAHRQAMGSFRHSTIIGHTHRMELSVIGSADGPPAVGAMFGWLGSFDHVDYMHAIEARANWVHGFGLGFQEPSGVVHLQPVPLVAGAAVVCGEVVR